MDLSYETVQPFVQLWCIGVAFWYLLKELIKRLWAVTDAMQKIAENMTKPPLRLEHALIIVEAICAEHISKKLDFLMSVFIANDIAKREAQIKVNFKSLVAELMQKDIAKLGEFVLPNGYCLNQPFKELDSDKFLEVMYPMIFAKEDILKKLCDIKTVMSSYTTMILDQTVKCAR